MRRVVVAPGQKAGPCQNPLERKVNRARDVEGKGRGEKTNVVAVALRDYSRSLPPMNPAQQQQGLLRGVTTKSENGGGAEMDVCSSSKAVSTACRP